MSARDELEALVKRLEEAKEGSVNLDCHMVVALDLERGAAVDEDGCEYECLGDDQHFTRSVDAALSLLPEWMSCELTRSAAGTDGLKRARLWDWRRSPTGFDPGNEWKGESKSTLPLATCIAALRARLAEIKDEQP